MDNPKVFEYSSAAVPIIDELKPNTLMIHSNTQDKITTPNLEIRYIYFEDNNIDQNVSNCSSHVFYVINGHGNTILDGRVIKWSKGDIFTLPYQKDPIKHIGNSDTILFYANDRPLFDFLKATPREARFLPTYYNSSKMMEYIDSFNKEEGAEKRNRNGILLSNSQMVDEKMNTLTHTMWSLLNSIHANTVQNPHKHNSIAVDLCIYADEENDGKVYTLMGKNLDQNGSIIDPIKMVWKTGCTFTTPPGWWHSHHNDSEKTAWVFPVQDAGLHTYLRTLNIQFV